MSKKQERERAKSPPEPAPVQTQAKKVRGRKGPSLTLSARQERFCELMAAGKNQTDAWLGAGYSPSSKVIASVNANEALKNPKIAKRISELRETDDIKTAMASKHQKRSILLAMILDPLTKPADRIRAIEVDSKLALNA